MKFEAVPQNLIVQNKKPKDLSDFNTFMQENVREYQIQRRYIFGIDRGR